MPLLTRPVQVVLALSSALTGLVALPIADGSPAPAGPASVASASVAPAAADPAPPDPTSGASEAPLPRDTVTLHVDGEAYDRVLPPDGSRLLPYPTITWGVAAAQQIRSWGLPVRIVVHPGTYREQVDIRAAGTNPPLVLEAAEPGTVVVSGAEVRTDWTPEPGTGRWTTSWTHDWGLAPVPAGWSGVAVPDGVRRREAVFVDGEPLGQVLARDELAPGTFFVDEAADRIVVHPPAGTGDLSARRVEVAERPSALRIRNRAHDVTVRGLVFEKAAAALTDHMAYVTDATDILIEGSTFRHSSWGGLGTASVSGLTLRGNRAVDNGGNGIDTYRTHDAVIEENLVERANQRGGRFGFVGWSASGSKHLLLHRAVLRHNTYHDSLARGLWLDTDVADVVIDGDRSTGNLRDGIFVEAVQGPLHIRASTFAGNGGAGILVGTSGDVTVTGSTLADNHGGQLVFSGVRNRSWIDHETGERIDMPDFRNWRLTGNQLSAAGAWPLVRSPNIPIEDWRAHLDAGAITARGNLWLHPSLAEAIRIQNRTYPLEEWNARTGDTAPGR